LVVLEFDFRASHLLGRCSTASATPPDQMSRLWLVVIGLVFVCHSWKLLRDGDLLTRDVSPSLEHVFWASEVRGRKF
jgi:hypothetical protein